LLFQHHLAPPPTSYTSEIGPSAKSRPNTSNQNAEAEGDEAARAVAPNPDSKQLENTFVLKEETIDSGYIIGAKPGVGRSGDVLNFTDIFTTAIRCRPLTQYLCEVGC
jgi:hypothetical protein